LPHTFADFWSMIWDPDVRMIVMLTNLCEGGKVKAHAYWPEQTRSKQYGDIFVLLESEEEFGSIVKRKFTVSKSRDISSLKVNGNFKRLNEDEKKVIQYHYIGWPDHGAPVESETILNLVDDVDYEECRNDIQKNPCLVHCSAGIGRTGTFVLIHSFIQNFKKQGLNEKPENLSLKPILSRMRNQRDGFVQRLSQYVFCYTTLERFFTRECRVNFSELKKIENSFTGDKKDDSSDSQKSSKKKKFKRKKKIKSKKKNII